MKTRISTCGPRSLLTTRRQSAAFTLVEMLVAVTILSLMLLSLASMMGFVTRAWINGVATVDNFNKARQALSVLDRDIQMMVLRRDLPAFVDSGGLNACAFYTNVEGNPGQDMRTLSLVQYSLVTSATSSVLQRQNYGMSYPSVTGSVSLTGTPTLATFGTGSLTVPANSSSQTDNVATGVIAFQIQFIDGTGTVQPLPLGKKSNPFTYDFTYPGDPTSDRVAIVSLVVMSNAAYNLAIQMGNLTTLAGPTSTLFSSDPPTDPYQTYSQAWNNARNSPSAAFLALPAPIRSGIQVYERRIPLPVTTPSS